MGILFRKLIKSLTSTRLALWLMLVLAVLIFYGAAPAKNGYIFSHPVFLVPAGLLFLNTLACTLQQIYRAWQRQKPVPAAMALAFRPAAKVVLPDGAPRKALGLLRDLLRKQGYRSEETQAEDGEHLRHVLMAHRRTLGYWGSPVFHVALLVIMAGGILSVAGRITDGVVLTEGSATGLNPQIAGQPSAALSLNGVKLDYDAAGKLTEVSGEIALQRGGRERTGLITSQLKFEDGLVNYSYYEHGYATGLIFRQDDQVVRARVALANLPDGKGGYKYEGDAALPGSTFAGKKFHISFWPNLVMSGDTAGTAGDAPKRPAVSVTLVDQAKQAETTKLIQLGETGNFAGLSVTFDHYKPWLSIKMDRDPGYPLFFAGFWLALAGLAVMFVAVPKQVMARIAFEDEQFVLLLGGRTYRFQQAFNAELAAIAAALGQNLAKSGLGGREDSMGIENNL